MPHWPMMRNSSLEINSSGDDSSQSHSIFILASSICLLLIEVLGILCNAVILAIYYKYSRLRTATNLFILNLALSNLLLALTEIVFSAPSSFNGGWLYGSAACIGYGFVHQYLMSVAVCTLAVIAFDRFCVITKPARNLRTFVVTKGHARALIVAVHFYSLLFTIPLLVGWNELVPEEHFHTGCYINFADRRTSSLVYIVTSTVFTCILPLVLTTFCYANIYRSVRNSSRRSILNRRKDKAVAGDSGQRRTSAHRTLVTHTRTARMITVVMFFFLLSWVPSRATGLCQTFGATVPPLVVYLSTFFAKSCVMYNAVVYVFLNHRFRAAFLHLTFLCRDHGGGLRFTSVTNHSSRFLDIFPTPSASEQCPRRSRVLSRKNLSQLSIIPVDGIPEISPTTRKISNDISADLSSSRTGSFASQRMSFSTAGNFRGVNSRDGKRGCVNVALAEEENDLKGSDHNGAEEQISGRGQDTHGSSLATSENSCGNDVGRVSTESKSPGAESRVSCHETRIELSDELERMGADQFLELDVNSLE